MSSLPSKGAIILLLLIRGRHFLYSPAAVYYGIAALPVELLVSHTPPPPSCGCPLQKPDVRRGDWRYLGSLLMYQRWLILASVVTLFLAAVCSVAGPHYSSRALNAAAFANDKAVSI